MANVYKNKLFIPFICIAIILLSLTFTIITVTGENSVGNSYYFDSSAKKNGSGTQSSPFNSLTALDELSLQPGDSIYLKKGSVFDGSLTLVGINGNEHRTITIATYGEGAKPRINGHDTIGEGVLHIENCSYITVSGLEICDTATYAAERYGVLINATSESPNVSSIILDNLYIHHIRGLNEAGKSGAIVAVGEDGASFSNFTVSNCYITDIYGSGIYVGNQDSYEFLHTGISIESNIITDVYGNAVHLKNLIGSSAYGNTVSDVAGEGCFVTEYVSESIFESNETYNNNLEIATYYEAESCDGNVYINNYSHSNEGGFFVSNTSDSKASSTLCCNLSVDNYGAIIGAKGAKINAYNNTIVCISDSAEIVKIDAGNLHFNNNIIYNLAYGSEIIISSNAETEISNNLVYTLDADISGLEGFKAINENGIYTDPMFVADVDKSFKAGYGIESVRYFFLSPSSPAINAGVDVDFARNDIFGNPSSNNIGFYLGSGETSYEADYEMNADSFTEYRYSDIEVIKDITYGTAISYKGSEKELKLDLYFANDCTLRNRPLLVMIHGGGLRSDSTKEQSYAVKISKLMASKGYVVASINYRTREGSDMPTKPDSAPALMDAAEDANSAIEWLRKQGGVYGFNPDYIFVGGGSAGGATAMTYAFAEESRGFNKSGIIAIANLWGGLRDVFADCYDSDFSQDDNFPTIFIHGTGDTTMEYTHSLNTYQTMLAKGITVSWNPISGAEHSLIGTDDTYEMTVGLISSFFADRLREKIAQEGYTQPPVFEGREENNDLPESSSEIIYPNADLYVNSNSYGKNAPLYSLDSLYVYDGSNSSYIRHTYMRFDVVDEHGRIPSSVVLNFTVTSCTGVSSSNPLNIAICGVADNHRFENEVTWKNSPDTEGRVYLGTVPVTGSGTYSLDVTNYVFNSKQNGIPTVTFCLMGKDSPSSSRRATIASVESGRSEPHLSCSYLNGELDTHTITVKTKGVGSSDITEATVVDGSSLTIMLKPGAGYVLSDILCDTSNMGVTTRINGNEVLIENIVADTVLTVTFTPSSSILLANDSTTVRYNSPSQVVVNTTDTSIDGNENPLFLCTKGPSGDNNNGSDRIIWISFDISNFDVNNDTVLFEIYCYKVVDFSGATMPVDVYATTNTDWSSETLAWGNQPTVDNLGFRDGILSISGRAQKIGQFKVTKASTWYSVDITSYVRALKLSGFTRFSLCLVDNDYTTTAPMARFVSTHGTAERNGESLAPRLNKEGSETSDTNSKINLDITVDGTENGSVSEYTNLSQNSPVAIRVSPNEGYNAIATVNGERRPIVNENLCLYGVTEDTKIHISFVKEHFVNIECSDQINAQISSAYISEGESLTVEFTVSAGYKPKVIVDGQETAIYDNKVVLTPTNDVNVVIQAIPINN